ncbi:putative RNA polymerase sigma factor [Actinoplanes missouriensis 431]|uniref:Putative RNA polymerase sigma factor n=1 Tax=Actinoplanes missouriensis (strain ATCC 14538 / DSM 43046 / CBS 188.64 / JCM 3121 / NBRC 102363 / NCIMB 12654 / NRRL B-3342 / UNCC 431) TaxID=512565 RepID=I0H9B6_ACTM4|nr:RNA polymerase sigma factor SigF [Actinoplanes missouriensis]BAL89603.1 putative RNA polymerase sigma factor [Actinoplanes missouriensis 431]
MTVLADAPARIDTSTTSTDGASELIALMAALPVGHPDRAALRDRAIEAWLPLARHLSNRYANRGEPRDDLYQVAVVGLIKAIDRFEPERGIDFAGFAVPTVVGELKRHFRDKTWSVRVPRRLQELRLAITGANNTLSHTLGRSPTVADIAGHLGISEDEVIEGLEGARAYNSTSLSTPIADNGTELGETLGGEDDGFAVAEMRIALGPALASLDEREQKIVSLRFYGNLTQTQIAEQVGISQMHVSRLLTKALAKLRLQLDGATA